MRSAGVTENREAWPKKKGGVYPVSAVRLPPVLGAEVDKWASAQADAPTRSEAIRSLVELWLKVKRWLQKHRATLKDPSPPPKRSAKPVRHFANSMPKRQWLNTRLHRKHLPTTESGSKPSGSRARPLGRSQPRKPRRRRCLVRNPRFISLSLANRRSLRWGASKEV